MARTTPDLTLPDLTDRRALVTGASDGMGVHIAARLAAAGAEVLVPVRDRAKGEAVAARLRTEQPAARLTVLDLDLSSFGSVRSLAAHLLEDGRPLHLVVNNAGVMTPPQRRESADGHELQLATNHLGHFALVGRLLPLLRDGAARVVSQTSIAARGGAIRWDDLDWQQRYDAMDAYRQSKIAVGLFGLELARRSAAEGWGVSSTVSHPGVAPTSLLAARPEMGRSSETFARRVIQRMSALGILVGTPESAGLPALLAATVPDEASGTFYGPQGPGGVGGRPGVQDPWRPLRDEEGARRLWTVSEELTGVAYDAGVPRT